MNHTFILLPLVWTLTFGLVSAQDTIFGPVGSGQPTKTVVGLLGGAAAGAAVGHAIDPRGDGWWIGALTGSAIGGVAGNSWGRSDTYNNSNDSYYSPEYSRRSYFDSDVVYEEVVYEETYYRRPYYYQTYRQPVVYERETIIREVPVVSPIPEQRETARREAAHAVWPIKSGLKESAAAATPTKEKAKEIKKSEPASEEGERIPYGFPIDSGRVKSPHTDFSISMGGKTRGDVLYDAHTGQPFRVP
ncbi:MAG: glycine zipper 2TM domain-containing protein [Verrucomicrobiota bacterium]|nr:glycine zipper 2TM domain-containing protein [Verrucomicrobiota bacterium]